MEFTLFTAPCAGKESNCRYPTKQLIDSSEALGKAVRFDHVCASFLNQYRSKENFQKSDVIVMDCDNSHTENPKGWIAPEKLPSIFPGVSMAIATSRNHMKVKDGKAARPRFHVYFPIEPIVSEVAYTALKHSVFDQYPFFDGSALDAARFIYGTVESTVTWVDGTIDILDLLAARSGPSHSIPQGKRNNTMSRFAGRVIKRYGASEKAFQIFFEESKKCDPPLEEEELMRIWHSAERFGEKISKQEGYVDPEKYNREFGTGESLKPEDYSDIGQAKILAREYRNELRYTDNTDFIRFNGIYWEESKQAAVGAAEEFLDLQLADALDQLAEAKKALVESGVPTAAFEKGGKTLEKLIEENQRKDFSRYQVCEAYKAFVMKRRDMRYIISALQALKPMIHMRVNELDRNEFLLNTPSATYDLRKGISGGKAHDPEDFITKCTTVDPGELGRKIWDKALREFFCQDESLIRYAQQICGLMAIGKVFVEALVIAYGDGRNGKSTYWNAIARVMGSYCGGISADALTAGCKRNVRPEMAELKGKRMVIAAEMEEGVRLSTSILKQLCSTDEVSGEKKYKDPFKFTPTHTLILYTNHLPRVGASDEGTWRRLIIIPFNAQFEGKTEVKNYTEYLVEKAGPAILAWIIEGARQVIKNAFHLDAPECVTEAIQKYRGQNDWLRHFLDDCCDVAPSFSEKSGALYTAYRSYCQQMNEYTRSTTDFYAALENAGFQRRRNKNGRMVYGLMVKTTDFLE